MLELEQQQPAWESVDALEAALTAIEEARAAGPRDFSAYADRPAAFATDVLKIKTLWEKQREILTALETHDRVAVYGAVNMGKDYVAAAAAMHAAYARGQMVLLTSASLRQVLTIGMRDVARFKYAAGLPGTMQKLSLAAPGSGGILGLTSTEGSKLSGHHHAGGVFIVISEAQSFDDEEQLAGLMSCASSEGSKVLVVGNPLHNSGWFPKICAVDSTWAKVQISAFDHPNIIEQREVIPGAVNQRYIDDTAKDFGGRDSAFYVSRVLGQFPTTGAANSIFTREMIERAIAKWRTGQ